MLEDAAKWRAKDFDAFEKKPLRRVRNFSTVGNFPPATLIFYFSSFHRKAPVKIREYFFPKIRFENLYK